MCMSRASLINFHILSNKKHTMSAKSKSDQCVKIEPNNEIDKLLYDTFTYVLRPGYVEIGEEKICMPMYYKEIADEIENFEIKDTDIIIASHPKTGTTWTQEMVWMILHDLDKEGGKIKSIVERSPFIELKAIFDYRAIVEKDPNFVAPPEIGDSINFAKNDKSTPRLLKTHLPWSLLPKQARGKDKKHKIIHVARNPKDTCVSFYHHSRLIEGYNGNFDAFQKLFRAGRLNYGPFWTNIMGYWERRNEPNVLFIKYEDMKKDQAGVIRRVAEFVGKKMSEEQMSALVDHLKFENMKKNTSVNYEGCFDLNKPYMINGDVNGAFMRSGTVGSYKADMTPEMIKDFDKWTEENIKGTGLAF